MAVVMRQHFQPPSGGIEGSWPVAAPGARPVVVPGARPSAANRLQVGGARGEAAAPAAHANGHRGAGRASAGHKPRRPPARAGRRTAPASQQLQADEEALEALQRLATARLTHLAGAMSGDSVARLQQEVLEDFAPDCEKVFQESEAAHGVAQTVVWFTRLKEILPDFHMGVRRVEVEEGRQGITLRVCAAFSGTQSSQLFPMFPVGKLLSFLPLQMALDFDTNGRITRDSCNLCLSGQLSLEPSVVDWLVANAHTLAVRDDGSRMLQDAFEYATDDDKFVLAQQFEGHVWAASADPNANFVLQTCIVQLHPQDVRFVADELGGKVAEAARHGIRSRILERMFEQFPAEWLDGTVGELVTAGLSLCRNPFGNFVLQRALEHGTVRQRSVVAEVLLRETVRLAHHHIASNVVRCALVNCSLDDRRRLAAALTADPNIARGLERHRSGNFVMREVRALSRTVGLAREVEEVSL